jgi:hypothetical protein
MPDSTLSSVVAVVSLVGTVASALFATYSTRQLRREKKDSEQQLAARRLEADAETRPQSLQDLLSQFGSIGLGAIRDNPEVVERILSGIDGLSKSGEPPDARRI